MCNFSTKGKKMLSVGGHYLTKMYFHSVNCCAKKPLMEKTLK